MTNVQIIMNESQHLMEEGIIKPTGRTITVEMVNEDGEIEQVKIPEPEPIHTYQKWKELGYQVQKGEKAIAQFSIWKHTTKKSEVEGEEDEQKMFMKKASWFKFSQVAPIEEKGGE